MRHKVTYALSLGPQYDMFGLEQSSPTNPVLVADNVSSDFSLSRIIPNESGGYIKTIYSLSSSARKTRITSNTSDVKMTNVTTEDGTPLFYKTLLKTFNKADVFINGVKAEVTDSHFIYLNETDAEITYYNQDGILLLRSNQEIYPVFIWEDQINLEDIIALDNRKYYFKESKGRVIISASKPDIIAEVIPEPIFTVKRIREKVVKIDPFIFTDLRSNDAGRLSFRYNYLEVIPDVVARQSEQTVLKNNNYIELANIDIIKESVVVYKRVNRVKEYVLNNENGLFDSIINSSLGRINTVNLIEDGVIDFDDIIYVDYRYLKTNTILNIDNEDIPLKNIRVYFRIGPTEIKKENIDLSFDPYLSYIVTDLDDNILLADDRNVSESPFVLPLHLGYSIGGFGLEGYGGIRTDFSLIIINGDGSLAGIEDQEGTKTGYGDIGYGDGPYGGALLKKIGDVENLLDIKNNSEAGTITISALEFYSKIKSSDIFPYLHSAQYRYDNGFRISNTYANTLWLSAMDGDTSGVIEISSATPIRSYSTIDFTPSVLFEDETKKVLSFDISTISKGFLNSSLVNGAYVLSGDIDQEAFDELSLFSATMPTVSAQITNLAAFEYVDDTYTELILDIRISNNLEEATIELLDLENKPINIGLGYKDATSTIYPTRMLKI